MPTLAPYGSQPECCEPPKRTKHHAIPDHCFKAPGKKGGYYQGLEKMTHSKGLCICVEGKDKNETTKTHAQIHKDFDAAEDVHYDSWTFGKAKKEAAKACAKHTDCKEDCLEQQLTQYHVDKGIEDDAVLRADSSGKRTPPDPSKMGTNMTSNETAAGW